MGVLGKDLLDFTRPRTHIKIQFGSAGYWVEDDPAMHSYGEALTGLLNYGADTVPPPAGSILRIYLSAGEDALSVQERYLWFLEELFQDAVPEKKKGQRKKPLEEQVYERNLDAFVSGVSLGQSPEVDAPQVNIQYAVLETEDGSHELVEKLYFDHLADFLYVEFMRGLQRGFVPKRCANCGRWFLQEPGLTYAYCDQPAPGADGLNCRDIGSKASFRDKVKNNGVWEVHQRAYKKYFARTKKGTMSKPEFEIWAREAEQIRDETLVRYNRAVTAEERTRIVEDLKEKLNRV